MTAQEFKANVPLRWSDQDINGHVNNAKIVTAIEESRIFWLNKEAATKGLTSFNVPKVVVSLEVQYKRPVSGVDDLTIYICTEKIGNTSFTLRYRGEQDGKVAFIARTVLVTLDRETQRPRRLDEKEIAYLRSYTAE
ncbi:acyl-CoA thioesterase [Citricoccus sp. NR2]|uniref:acyl-CoA thioesterase n=1 Tax=Citricoccus sp. NR2 TaxID=3004095 RepID=UPI0022DE00F8|nr:thioesterase family protein [Citricoccus sp. NR2]WBL19502.1 thioesterase family protein [Citricoccus sp. NR2]